MLGAVHKLGRPSVMLRSMLSLEPATVTDRRYPLLLETGETVYGVPLVDAQHPHDFVMELSVQYAHPPGEKGTWDVYYAPSWRSGVRTGWRILIARALWNCLRRAGDTTGKTRRTLRITL